MAGGVGCLGILLLLQTMMMMMENGAGIIGQMQQRELARKTACTTSLSLFCIICLISVDLVTSSCYYTTANCLRQ
jgi:hypothetical protein